MWDVQKKKRKTCCLVCVEKIGRRYQILSVSSIHSLKNIQDGRWDKEITEFATTVEQKSQFESIIETCSQETERMGTNCVEETFPGMPGTTHPCKSEMKTLHEFKWHFSKRGTPRGNLKTCYLPCSFSIAVTVTLLFAGKQNSFPDACVGRRRVSIRRKRSKIDV